jgi:hypothetical protein
MKRRFLFSEQKLSEVTGISRTSLKKLRIEMPKGKYWRKSKHGKGGSIELSQEAVDIVLKTFGISDTDITNARISRKIPAICLIPPTIGADTSIPKLLNQIAHPTIKVIEGQIQHSEPPKLLKVVQLPPNKRLVKASNGTGIVYDVIVPNNIVWACGDPLRAVPSKLHKPLLELVGKSPRWRSDRMYRLEFV